MNCLSLFKRIIDNKIGDDSVLDCPIRRNNWSHPLIFQWHRSINNYTIPIASQFDHYPIHIDDTYRNRYSLLSNGSLKIVNIQINDNDTYECRLILIDRGFLDIKEKYSITLRVNGNTLSFCSSKNNKFLPCALRITAFHQSIGFYSNRNTIFRCKFSLWNLRCSNGNSCVVQSYSARKTNDWWGRLTTIVGQ